MDASALESAEFWLSWIATLKLAAAALVAAGVVLEFGSEWLSRPFEATVKHARELQIATLEKDGNEARAAVAQSNERASAAEQRAAEANLELARMKAPRVLSLDAQDRIVRSLTAFAGTQFDIGAVPADPEVFDFVYQLENVLARAHWQQVDWMGGDITLGRSVKSGFTLGWVTASDLSAGAYPEKTTLGVAAGSLTTALEAEGVKAKHQFVGETFINKNRDVVHIIIGRKT